MNVDFQVNTFAKEMVFEVLKRQHHQMPVHRIHTVQLYRHWHSHCVSASKIMHFLNQAFVCRIDKFMARKKNNSIGFGFIAAKCIKVYNRRTNTC